MKSSFRRWRALGIASALSVSLLIGGFWVLAHHWLLPDWMPSAWYLTLIATTLVWAVMFLGKDA